MSDLSWFIPMVFASIDFNFTNFTSSGILRVGFQPYLVIFGNFTWGIIFGFIGAGLYANERSIGTITIYLILVGVFVSILFPASLIGLFGLILVFTLTVIFYKAFIQNRE
jgi:hypothetical protein